LVERPWLRAVGRAYDSRVPVTVGIRDSVVQLCPS
jgi:hypothetical protein